MLRKVKQKVFEIFKLRAWEEDMQRCPEKQMLKPICAIIAPVLHFYFRRKKKYFLLLFLFYIKCAAVF